jgi:hypothetical protein
MTTIEAFVVRLQQVGIANGIIFAGSDIVIPKGQGPYVSLLATPGRPPIGVHNSTSLRQPSIQLTVRGGTFPTVASLSEQCYNAMGHDPKIVNLLIGDVFFLSINPEQEPFSLPNDAVGRIRLAFNVLSLRR